MREINKIPLERKIAFAKDTLDLYYLPYLDAAGRLEWYFCKGILDGAGIEVKEK